MNEDNNDFKEDESVPDLDMSWINEEERIQNITSNYYRESMDTLHACFIYINQNLFIDKILCEKFNLDIRPDGSGSQLSKETLLQIIQNKKIRTPFSKYKLIDILQYHVDLEPEHIQSYSKNAELDIDVNTSRFFKSLPIFDEIIFRPSIFIFHSINCVYFFFQEVEIEKIKHRKSMKSILKTGTKAHLDNKSTKKVKISTDTVQYSPGYKHRKTKKNISFYTTSQ